MASNRKTIETSTDVQQIGAIRRYAVRAGNQQGLIELCDARLKVLKRNRRAAR